GLAHAVSVLLNTTALPAAILGNLATGTITESDTLPIVQFSVASESVSETAGTFSLTVTLSAAAGVATSIPFALGGTAVAGADYGGVTASPLDIAAGSTSGTITGTLFDNDRFASSERTLTVTLQTPSYGVLGAITTNTLIISGSDTPPPSVSIAFAPGGQVTVVVTPSGLLYQFDPSGAHFLGSGARTASVAFVGGAEVLDVVFENGLLYQFDPSG